LFSGGTVAVWLRNEAAVTLQKSTADQDAFTFSRLIASRNLFVLSLTTRRYKRKPVLSFASQIGHGW
jgi:hypothetical protein